MELIPYIPMDLCKSMHENRLNHAETKLNNMVKFHNKVIHFCKPEFMIQIDDKLFDKFKLDKLFDIGIIVSYHWGCYFKSILWVI